MKKLLSLSLALLLLLGAAIPAAAGDEPAADPPSAESTESADVIVSEPAPATDGAAELPASGTWGENITWTVGVDRVLVFSGTGGIGSATSSYFAPWNEYDPVRAVFEPGITDIGAYTMAYCDTLESVTLPEGLNTIGLRAFYRCGALRELTLPDTLTAVSDEAFSLCTSLTELTVPSSVQAMGMAAFSHCTSLRTLTLRTTALGPYAFSGCAISELTIPEGTTTIPAYCFNGCKELVTVHLPSTLETLGGFEDCSALAEIEIPDGVKVINSAFTNCVSLTEITLPDSVERLAGDDFRGCTGLRTVHLGTGLKNIGYQTFAGCSSLTDIDLPACVERIGESAFTETDIREITIPEGVKALESYTFFGCPRLERVILPDSLESIGPQAFYHCTALKDIRFGSGLRDIGGKALEDTAWWYGQNWGDFAVVSGCLLAYLGPGGDVVIPDSVRSISDHAFSGLDLAMTVTVPGTVSTVGLAAFEHNTGLTHISFTEGLTTISGGAFHGCTSLERVDLPVSLTLIDYDAFWYCPALRDVYYAGSPAEWERIDIENIYTSPATYALNTAERHYGREEPLPTPTPTPTPIPESVPLDAAHFPDASFRAFVKNNYDTDGDGVLSRAEREAVTGMYCHSGAAKNVRSFAGIEYFPALQELSCTYQSYLTSLDVSRNTALTSLWCFGTKLTTLDVSTVPGLNDLALTGEVTRRDGRVIYSKGANELDIDDTVVLKTDSTLPPPAPTPIPTPAVLPGDADGDGTAGPWDAVLILQYAAGRGPRPAGPGADADGDSEITVRDAALALR